jgi:hypothetical protein
MINENLNSEIIRINDDDFNKLFDETPNSTVTVDSLVGAKEKEEDKDEELNLKIENNSSIVPIDLDSLDEDGVNEDKKKEEKEEDNKNNTKEKNQEKVGGDDVVNYNEIVKYLIETNSFLDFEGRESLDIDGETFKTLLKNQVDYKVKDLFEEMLDSTGDYGKAIINFKLNGGNPDEIIDLFKEEKSISSIDTTTEEGKISKIKKCYKELYGWKDEKINKYLDKLIVDDELDSELADVNEKFDLHYKEELDKINEEQLIYNKQQQEREKAFKKNINDSLSSREDLNQKDKSKVIDYILNYNEKLPDGTLVNKFYLDFAKVQSSPNDYIDLALFIMDKNKFIEKISKTKESEITTKTFNFIKGNSTINSTKGSGHVERNRQVEEFNFGIKK